MYSVSTNFRFKLIEPAAREVIIFRTLNMHAKFIEKPEIETLDA